MRYLKLFEKFNFDELVSLSDMEKAILHLVRVHEKYYYNDTKISDEFMFKRDIKYILQMSIDKKGMELFPRRYPRNPNLSKGISHDHILATISDYQMGIYDSQDLFGIDDDNYDSSLKLEIELLIKPLKDREDDFITTDLYINEIEKAVRSAMSFNKDEIYKRRNNI